jgi:hypothetical protein
MDLTHIKDLQELEKVVQRQDKVTVDDFLVLSSTIRLIIVTMMIQADMK